MCSGVFYAKFADRPQAFSEGAHPKRSDTVFVSDGLNGQNASESRKPVSWQLFEEDEPELLNSKGQYIAIHNSGNGEQAYRGLLA